VTTTAAATESEEKDQGQVGKTKWYRSGERRKGGGKISPRGSWSWKGAFKEGQTRLRGAGRGRAWKSAVVKNDGRGLSITKSLTEPFYYRAPLGMSTPPGIGRKFWKTREQRLPEDS